MSLDTMIYSSKKFLILAGGFGTRIASSIGGLPKVLAPVHDKPFLFYQMNNWISHGIVDFTFLLHYKAELIIEFLEEYKQHNAPHICYNFILEKEPLGTGGAILNAVVSGNIEKCIIINADTWIESGFKEAFAAITPSILVTNVKNASRFGRVNLDSENLVLSFDEKDGLDTPGLINAGLFFLTRKILGSVQKTQFSLEREVLEPLIKSQNLQAIISDSIFFDIGVPEDLNLFREYILKTQLT
jgi:D-glycero-alpha-D-manno-heptose 1-phosphate guanylyltransferase